MNDLNSNSLFVLRKFAGDESELISSDILILVLTLTLCPCSVQKKSIKGVLLQLNDNRHPKELDENPHLVKPIF